jgi:hypothetical protein
VASRYPITGVFILESASCPPYALFYIFPHALFADVILGKLHRKGNKKKKKTVKEKREKGKIRGPLIFECKIYTKK